MRRNAKGFTLMELMVVIVIVAILAAVAVPLYINYVHDAQRTEAKGAIGAVITAEQTHFQRYGAYLPYTNADFTTPPAGDQNRLNCDIREAQVNWTFVVTTGNPANDFHIQADGIAGHPTANLQVTYTLDRTTPPTDPWTEQ
jgi:prepilin-type N-terminal cleavage/methylation domain-containing protein